LSDTSTTLPLQNAPPKLPVFGWQTLSGQQNAEIPCLLSRPRRLLTTSGRAAILLALEQLGVGPGDIVLMPSYHCPTMISPVTALGATPLFYPITAAGAPDQTRLQALAQQRPKAMLVAHFFGLPQPMAELRAWCDHHGIALIEDCAHSIFGASGERTVGAWGDLAIASLTKFFPTPEGGCLVLNRADLSMPTLSRPGAIKQLKAALDIIHMGANHGRLHGLNGFVRGLFSLKKRILRQAPQVSETDDVGYGGVDMQLSHRALTSASRWVSAWVPRQRIVVQRQRNFDRLLQLLSGHEGLHPLMTGRPTDCAPYVFPLWVDTPDPGYAELRRLGIPVSRWDRVWPDVPVMPNDMGGLWSCHVLQLACHQDLREQDLQQMAQVILRLYAQPR